MDEVLTSFRQRREKLRAILASGEVTSPGSVFDAVSARLAQYAGYEYGLMGGSIASHVVLGAPDVNVMTLSELAEQSRRICRGSDLPLIVDADHGFGNALNVRRTVEELEAAGVAALTIEDTLLPQPFGNHGRELVSREELSDKLRAAVDARSDSSLLIIARTDCFSLGAAETIARARLAAEAQVDAIFFTGHVNLEALDGVCGVAGLPLIVNDRAPPALDELQRRGVRILYEGHQPYFVGLQAVYESYLALRNNRAEDLRRKSISGDARRIALAEDLYSTWAKDWLG